MEGSFKNVILTFGLSSVTLLSFAQKQPNIVFILADDLGWKDLGCYGNPNVETPNIDQLAQKGVRFTQAYAACPVCSPTRASILTGKYPARIGLTNFIKGEKSDPQSPVLPARWTPFLDTREITIAEMLHSNGYRTAMVGKWHVGTAEDQAPWNQGFDYTRMIAKNGLDYYNYSICIDSYQNEFTDNGTNYLTDKLTDYGIEFIEKEKDNPFFLYLSYSAPHVTIVPRGDKLRKYFFKYAKATEKFNPYYAAMIESLDEGVGRIVAKLEEEKLLENTLIVFTSDNGGLGMDELGPTPTSMLPLRMWKGHVYEGGIRVPAIVSWPGKIDSGIVSETCYTSTDYFPTFCEVAQIKELPAQTDGISQLQVWQGDNTPSANRALFWHYPHFSNQRGRPAGAVRSGDFKLVENYEDQELELYNIREDIGEQHNLADQMPEKARELYQLLNNWRKAVKANMPLPNPDYNRP